jgi:hypothetical protein
MPCEQREREEAQQQQQQQQQRERERESGEGTGHHTPLWNSLHREILEQFHSGGVCKDQKSRRWMERALGTNSVAT